MLKYAPRPRKAPSNTCPKCGSVELTTKSLSDTVDFRGLTLDVEGLVFTICEACRHRFETDAQKSHNESLVREAFVTERDKVRERDGLLSSEQIASIRKRFNLTQREAATLFGGGPNAFNKYETGEVLQSAPMDRLLRLVDVGGLSAVVCLEKIVKHHRPNFCLPCKHDHQPAKRLYMNLYVGSEGVAPFYIAITNPKTQEQVASVVRNAVFEEVTPSSVDKTAQPHYLNSPSASHTPLFFREI